MLLAASFVAHAQAGPPMITNDPDTPGAGVWEINIAATGSTQPHGETLDAPDLDINRGVGDRIQLSVHAAWAHARARDAWSSGLGDVELGMRYRFLDADDDGISLAVQLLYIRGWSAAARRRGLASDHPEWVLPVQLARPLATFSVGMEVARHFVEHDADAWQAGVFVAHDCFGGDCLAEVNTTRVDGDASRTTYNVGARHPIAKNILLMASLGRESGAGEPASVVSYIGLQYVH
ncbi:hypothetical protein [Lysobacter sp. HA18]